MESRQTRRVTQATLLPKSAKGLADQELSLAPIGLLQGAENLFPWMDQVKAELNRWGLMVMVDPHLPPPGPHDPEYERWNHFKHRVLDWLSAHVSQEIRNGSRWAWYTIQSPVDYLMAVEFIVRQPDARLARDKWDNALRFLHNEHRSIKEYITELKRAVMASDLVGTITPFQATCILLSGLEKSGEDGRQFSERIFSTLPLDIARIMTMDHFFAICDDASGIGDRRLNAK
ncbi:hypothetical protein BO78DRAFT_395191 [Aspergillus sclerotiicarbonarius CBS 121057]|uniref:Retrotransposon gag domain-containing protein n=1 Tax=Aspergillus sclerotiicarbonarius (strain CBS 121057 / IBT 28362) TaxID=1448318 RepID=A0A319EMJ6_ASPSB|nr:hypothetical protein BO78DRAFT_395191 [Aspergillus sclerotiicarbonarius CBS 121057]